MKKFFSMIAVFAAMFAFASCTPEEGTDKPGPQPGPTGSKLATPVLTETHTETSFTVAWEAVTNADSYMVNLDGKNYTTAECSYTFENLNAGDYTVRVKAKGAGYEDSDNAKIVISLTGLTSVDWFTQGLFVLEEPYEFEDGSVAYPYNSLVFEWKGTGVADIQYGMFATAEIAGAKDGDIKAALNGLGSSLSSVLGYVNADGFQSIFSDLSGSTSYTLCTLVTNTEGVECLVKSEATTVEAVQTEGLKRWIGSYTAQTAKMVDIQSDPLAITDVVTEFSFDVYPVEGTPDQVWIDGLSQLGKENYMSGAVISEDGVDYLCVLAFEAFAQLSDGWYAVWIPFCSLDNGEHTFVTGNFYGFIFAMNADGTIEFTAGAGELNSGNKFTVESIDALGYNEQGGLGILSLQDGTPFSMWKYGPITNVTKAAASASVKSAQAKNFTVGSPLAASVVVAM